MANLNPPNEYTCITTMVNNITNHLLVMYLYGKKKLKVKCRTRISGHSVVLATLVGGAKS